MNETVDFLARHGYWLLIGAVLGRQACLPIPANLTLIAAGALAHSGGLRLSSAVGLSVLTFLAADLAWFEAGRRFGNRILHFVCGLSGDPEACAHSATQSFTRHGVNTLLVSKFVIGLDAVAVPLAGAGGIRWTRFLLFDALGAFFWSSTYAALGYVFSNQLERLAVHLERIGAIAALAAAAALGFYIARKFARWQTFLREFRLARITPEQLREKLGAGEDILLIDLQGRPGPASRVAIPGAVRMNPRRLEQYQDVVISPSREVVLYCACPGEITSARVALALRQKGVRHVRPLAGGLLAWRARGFPVTADVPNLPAAAVRIARIQ
jgi:membrane protein DedA with SNARE-associated domain/rhodanese-related sulfurtransferase